MRCEKEGPRYHIDSSGVIKLKLNSRPSLTIRYSQFFAACFIKEFNDFEWSVKFPLKAVKASISHIKSRVQVYAAKIGSCIIRYSVG